MRRSNSAVLWIPVLTTLAACQANRLPTAPGAQAPPEAEQSALARACAPGAGPAVPDGLRQRVSAAGSLAVLVRLRVSGTGSAQDPGYLAAIGGAQQKLLAELTASTGTPAVAMPDSTGLFTAPPGVPAVDIARETGVIRHRYVGVNFGQLPASLGSGPQTLALNLFEDAIFTGVIEQVEPSPAGPTIAGRLQGIDGGTMTLVTIDGVMIGSVTTPTTAFQVRYAGNGVHAVREFDASQLPRELPAVPPPGDTTANQPFAVTETFRTVPLLGLRITASTLDALSVSAQVACVGEDSR